MRLATFISLRPGKNNQPNPIAPDRPRRSKVIERAEARPLTWHLAPGRALKLCAEPDL